jgi:pimeloyl-ACP methyl ester carboxylesterase
MHHALRFFLISILVAGSAAEALETTRIITRDAIVARYKDSDSKFMELGDIKVHYKEEGSGPVLLLVHGTFGDLHDWDEWAKSLKASYRIVRLDLPAFGLSSEIPSGNYSVDRMLSLIDSLMDNLNIERFSIAGVSYGGLIAFRYAATRTERVSALVLMNSAGIEFGRPQPVKDTTTNKPAYNFSTDPMVRKEDVLNFFNYYVNDHSRLTPELIQRKLDYQNVINRDQEGLVARKQYERGDPVRVLSHVRAPSLVLWGDANNALQTKTADAFIAALKNACSTRLIVYKGAGHMINIDRPDETVKDVKLFLSQQARTNSDTNARCEPR